jgi:hypothetical protein
VFSFLEKRYLVVRVYLFGYVAKSVIVLKVKLSLILASLVKTKNIFNYRVGFLAETPRLPLWTSSVHVVVASADSLSLFPFELLFL